MVVEIVKEGKLMCFFKKCKYSAIVKSFKGQTIAEICPKCKQKKSFVTIPNLFTSLTVDKPQYYTLGNVEYLTTSGTGIINNQGKEVEGIFTMILSDSKSKFERFTFEFLHVTPSGCAVVIFISFTADIKIEKCSLFGIKKKHRIFKGKKDKNQFENDKKEEKIHQGNCQYGPPLYMNYARKVIFYPNGRVDEEVLINCSYYCE